MPPKQRITAWKKPKTASLPTPDSTPEPGREHIKQEKQQAGAGILPAKSPLTPPPVSPLTEPTPDPAPEVIQQDKSVPQTLVDEVGAAQEVSDVDADEDGCTDTESVDYEGDTTMAEYEQTFPEPPKQVTKMYQLAKKYLYALGHNLEDNTARAALQQTNDHIEKWNKNAGRDKDDFKINFPEMSQSLAGMIDCLKRLQTSPGDEKARNDYNKLRELIGYSVDGRHFPEDWIPGELPEPGAGVERFADLLKSLELVEVPNTLSGKGASNEQSGGAESGHSNDAAPKPSSGGAEPGHPNKAAPNPSSGGTEPDQSNEAVPNPSSGGTEPGHSNEAAALVEQLVKMAPKLPSGGSTSSAAKTPMRPKPAKVSVTVPKTIPNKVKHKVSVKIRDESDGNTSVGKVVMAKRIGAFGARVIVNRGTDEFPYYEVYPGSQFLKGQARDWAEKEQFEWPDEIPLGIDADIIGRAEVEPKSSEGRRRPIRYYVVKMGGKLYGFSKTGLETKGRIGAAKLKHIDKDLDQQLKQTRIMLNDCRVNNLHPDTDTELTKEEGDKMPWLSSDAVPGKYEDNVDDNCYFNVRPGKVAPYKRI